MTGTRQPAFRASMSISTICSRSSTAAASVSFLPRQPVHSLLSGRFASRMRGRGLNFEEIRDYRPGDDVRSIDWKVTARLQQPHVRVFNEERDRQALAGGRPAAIDVLRQPASP